MDEKQKVEANYTTADIQAGKKEEKVVISNDAYALLKAAEMICIEIEKLRSKL